MDPLAEKIPNWTPYRYGFDNPNNNKDIGGNFELKDANKYPTLAYFLEKGIQGILNNPKIIKNLEKYGHLSISQIQKDILWNNGPIICPVPFLGSEGYYKDNKLLIDYAEVRALEDAVKNNDLHSFKVQLFYLLVIILHEYVHYGNDLAGVISKDINIGNLDDFGFQFEKKA